MILEKPQTFDAYDPSIQNLDGFIAYTPRSCSGRRDIETFNKNALRNPNINRPQFVAGIPLNRISHVYCMVKY